MNTTERPRSSPSGWLWLLPRLAFALFVAAMLGLLWLSERSESEEQRATLISDVLWLEQDLHFHLTHNEELLGRIGPSQAVSPASFEPHARAILTNGTGIRQVMWLDAAGTVRQALPSVGEAQLVGEADTVPSAETFRLARAIGKTAYGPTYPVVGNDWQFEVHVPLFLNGSFAGVAVGVYSIRGMIEESVPWWLAERNRISIVDGSGNILGSRSKVDVVTTDGGYSIPFDPPGQGLVLQAIPYRSPMPLVGRLLSVSLVILALLVLGSLWALRRHVQRRLAAEDALRTEYAFRRAMEDSLQTGLRARAPDGRITYVNPAFCRMVGWTPAELVGHRPPMPYWVDEEIEATRELHDRILAGEGPEQGFEIRLKRRSGEIFWALIHEAPLIDAQGHHTGWMSSVVDITEQKIAEELARQQQERLQATARLVTMGEMASSLAHELNQPLAAIASYNAGCLNLIDSGNADCAELKPALQKSVEQAQRAGRIIRRIYEFARRSEPKVEDCDPVQVVDEVMTLVEADARRQGMRIVRDIAPALPHFRGDRVLLGQTLLNLARNGIDAMKSTRQIERVLTIRAAAIDQHLVVDIADVGAGIAATDVPRLFEPFFTTKPEGMGMGLNICRSVIEAHHGRLWYEPNPEGGSIFRIQIPLAPS